MGNLPPPVAREYYLIHFNDGTSVEATRPDFDMENGVILIFMERYETPGNEVYEIGDEIHLMCNTEEAPWGRRSSLGNWKCITRYGVSIWANIEWMVAEGVLKVDDK